MSDEHRFVLIRKDLLQRIFGDEVDREGNTPEDIQAVCALLETDAANLDRLIGDAMAAQLIDGVDYIGYTYDVSVGDQDACDVTVTFTKKGGKTAHDKRMDAEAKVTELQAEVTRLRAAQFIPGVVHCAKCKFRLNRVNMSMQTGTTSAGGNQSEPCPNGCGPLWPVTWEQDLREEWARQENDFENLVNQRDYAVAIIKGMVKGMGVSTTCLTEKQRRDAALIHDGVGLDEILNPHLKSIAKPPIEAMQPVAPATAEEFMDSQLHLDCPCPASCDQCDPNNTMERPQ